MLKTLSLPSQEPRSTPDKALVEQLEQGIDSECGTFCHGLHCQKVPLSRALPSDALTTMF